MTVPRFQPELQQGTRGEAVSTASMVLPPAAVRRLSNQIGRAFRGTYGAQTGLRILVGSMARQLLGAGASPDALTRALEQCVLAHPGRLADDRRSLVTGTSQCATLVRVTRECVAATALELGLHV